MKKQIDIVIDMTKSKEEIWAQIDEAYNTLIALNVKKPSLWKRIKSWFRTKRRYGVTSLKEEPQYILGYNVIGSVAGSNPV